MLRNRVSSGISITFVGLAIAACSQVTGADQRPESARIVVEGSAPEALRLVVSTDFVEVRDPIDLDVSVAFNSADTLFIAPPFDQRVDLDELGSIYVQLSNLEVDPADIRMQVYVDGRRQYDQEAVISEAGALIFTFVFSDIFGAG